ncbi:MAG: polyhydroxyalkanoic acid system family protein [Erythrobacter sp.]|nr:polyhydroxyalkanoic acid system family protein [Erythrobacter sp.]
MRVPIAHDLPKEEVRRRLRDRSHEIANFVPGGMAEVTTGWPDEDRMTLGVRAMGQGIDGEVIIEDRQVIFVVNLPPALSFVEPMVAGAIRDKGQKLLAS